MDSIMELFNLPAGEAFYRIMFWYFGWLPLAILYLYASAIVWRYSRRMKWGAKQSYVLLAIDVPENNAQSPKAVENLFTYLAGGHKNLNLIEEWWTGMFQLSFSIEIVGIDGYIQFLINTPVQFKSLVETAVYSQYPDAEITEVEDYTKDTPSYFPNEEYDCWGAEFILTQNHMLPIKLYKEFEHQMGPPETHYRDPMAGLMDLLSSLQRGEQVWYQILVIPTDFKWVKEGDKMINKIAGVKEKVKPGTLGKIMAPVGKALGDASYIIAAGIDPSREPGEGFGDQQEEPPAEYNSMKLKPGQQKQIEAIQAKISKMGFEVKIRMVYLAKKDVINKPKVINGFVGFIKQFTNNDLNGLKPDMELTASSAAYFRAEARMNIRKTKVINAYKRRDDVTGRKPFIMNSEELATLWHFPIDAVVKAPLIQRAAARRVEAPITLPTGEQQVDQSAPEPIFDADYEIPDDQGTNGQTFEPVGETNQDQAPDNLPFA